MTTDYNSLLANLPHDVHIVTTAAVIVLILLVIGLARIALK